MPYTNELNKELQFRTSRSSGPGGQNVNKVESKVELYWNVAASTVLREEEKGLVSEKLARRINNAGEFILSSQTERSQLRNKEQVVIRFYALLNSALVKQKKRKPSKPTRASIQRRIDHKKKTASNKKLRQNPEY
jgi:ribosome-associated protein